MRKLQIKKLILAISVFLLFGSSFANALDVYMDFTAQSYVAKNTKGPVTITTFSCYSGNCMLQNWLISTGPSVMLESQFDDIKILFDNMKDSIGFEFSMFGGLRNEKCSLEYEDATAPINAQSPKYVTFFKCIAKEDGTFGIKKGDVIYRLYKESVSLTHIIGEKRSSSRYINGNPEDLVPKK